MSSDNGNKLVSRTFRLDEEMAKRLAVEATMRKVSGEQPDSQQGILQEALGLWFNVRGVTEPQLHSSVE